LRPRTSARRHYEEYERDLSRSEVLPYIANKAELFKTDFNAEGLRPGESGKPEGEAGQTRAQAILSGYKSGASTPGGSFAF
jgi:hypothetical protein